MAIETQVIMQALAPGVALTSMIFYYGNLQARLIFTTETIRRLNSEARELAAAEDSRHVARLDSLQWQVEFLRRRFNSIRRAILFVYAGFVSSIATILALLLLTIHAWPWLSGLPVVSFGFGFVCVAMATLLSSREISLAQATILEDIESSHGADMRRPHQVPERGPYGSRLPVEA